MTNDEVRKILFDCATLRMPRFDDRDTVGARIDKLERYLLTIAISRGDLEEGRLHIQQALRNLVMRWENITGWELHAPATEKARTKENIRQAKRLVGDGAAIDDAIEECKWLIARLTEQINRLSKMGDDQIASRAYTLLAGS